MSRLGYLEPFNGLTNDWPSYEERLTSYLQINQVAEVDRVHGFLSLIGPKTCALLKLRSVLELLSAKMFDELKTLLRGHLAPRISVIAEQARFYKRSQRDTETIAEFVAELWNLARIEIFLDQALHDRVVCGAQNCRRACTGRRSVQSSCKQRNSRSQWCRTPLNTMQPRSRELPYVYAATPRVI